ncbi:GPI inositol-deacylase protein [Moesziomyces antarcticus]|uniref:GPI inositol-deacylase n=2 Tax=Pseudozyma antarctica TaxID=84753 RepID=A0A081CMG4_PSEA2|nr:GPI inositol-deacylase protein [Moesziomyces antarcticus]GAK67860.1 GPI inositol-deacylase protein [Moesziomyces antarcticus]SPO47139.1 related to BST1 - negative regulator of COPII vesicle formation [Moesziomyces antarcticus]
MATVSAADRSLSRPSRRLWLPWLLLAISLILVTYSVDSFLRLPQQLAISQQCRMSRMRPAYIDHTADLETFSPSGLWRKYRLYLYRERDFDPMDLPSGSPALFVPGNAGSYGQVRSVSSSAARQFYKQNSGGQLRDEWKDAPAGVAHTDWYTLDFNEDFSAFSGSTLIEQATFINEVIAYLSNRYASPATRNFAAGERNTTVPILAHSMGGIAARLAAHMPNYPQGSIDTIVTLSTPHAYPPVPFDRSTEYVYSLINRPTPAAPSGSPASVPPLLVSVAGGILDTQLPSDPSSLALARIGEDVAPSRISTFTTSLPSLWSSVDHLAVMWCDQLREKIARGFLLDMMAFGRIAQDRSAGGITGRTSFLRRRRELWRRALSLFDSSDAGNGDIGPLELVPSKDSIYDEELESFVVEGETPTFNRPASGVDSPLLIGEDSFVYRVPARLGEDDTDVHAFELITNLCVGWNPSSGLGAPVPQPVEIVVQTCTSDPDSSDPIAGRKISCQLVMPWQWELVPPSLLPRTDILSQGPDAPAAANAAESKPFPDAEEPYHVPGLAFQRLRLDAVVLKRRRVDFIRVERKAVSGSFVHARGLKSFIRAGWMRQDSGRVEKHGSAHVLTPAQNTATQQHHQDYGLATVGATPIATEWSLKGVGSSLLARRIEVVLSQCLVENLARYTLVTNDEVQYSTDPSFSPFLHVSNRATGDSRWYPQLASPQLVRSIRNRTYKGEAITFPLSLHGNAPFMPPARQSVDEVKVQLWSDSATLLPVHGKQLSCQSPIESIRISIDWKASAGLVLLRYRFFLAAWPLGLLVVCVGLSWLAWAAKSDKDVFPSPLHSIMQPAFRTPLLGHRIDPLLGLLACLTAGLLLVDSIRLALYRALPDAQSHGPSSSLLGIVLGLSEHSSSAGLVPCFMAVSYAALLAIVAVVQLGFRFTAAVMRRCGLGGELDWVGSTASSSDPLRWNPRSIAGLALLLLSVVLFVPHQFVFLCIFLLQMLNTLRAQLELQSSPKAAPATVTSPRARETRLHQHLTIFLVLLLLLPQKASFLVTWVRNLASVGITTPKTTAAWMDHNVLDVAPVVVLVWLMAGGRRLEPPRSGLEAKAVAAGFGVVGWYALVWGIRYTYRTYDAFNVLCALLAICQWRSRRGGSLRSHDRSSRAGGKDSDETLGMLHNQDGAEVSSTSKLGNGRQGEAYELAARSDSERLPIHHLAIPASLASSQQDAAAETPVEREPDSQSDAAQPSTSTSGDRLDTLIGQYLDVLDRYQQLRNASCESFSRGYLKLSRAKMEYGASRLSSNSYDSRLLGEIRAKVDASSSKLTGAAATSAEAGPKRILAERFVPDYSHLTEGQGEAESVLVGLTDEKECSVTATRQENTASVLRRRAGPVSPAGQDAANREEGRASLPSTSLGTRSANSTARKIGQDDESKAGKDHQKRLPDALLQFGGLPTPSLRGAQVDLKRSLDQILGVGVEHAPAGEGLVQLVSQLDYLANEIAELRRSDDN